MSLTRVKLDIKIPAGIQSGQQIRIPQKGERGTNGGPNGDLYIEIMVTPHPTFKREDNNIFIKVPISSIDATIGCTIQVPTVYGDVELKIPEGTQPNTKFRLVPFFVNRSIYYASKAFVAQRKKFDEAGVRTAVLYQFVPVYVVCIMNFMPREHEVTKFRTDVALREKSSDSMFSDKLRFIYLSLPFFDKSEEECETGFEKWIYVLKYMEVLERLPFTAQKKIFDHLAKLADVRCLSSEEQEKYDESIKAIDDYYSGLYGSYVDGEEKGIAKVARNLLAMGMSWPQIIQATGLTEDQLKQLQS